MEPLRLVSPMALSDMRIFLLGYPSDVGGACTEAWHTIKLWRKNGVDVHLIPTWHANEKWRQRTAEIGCITHDVIPETLHQVPGLEGGIVVTFCNGEFLSHAKTFFDMGCKVIWANCMTFLFDAEHRMCAEIEMPARWMFQSEFQRSQLEPQIAKYGYEPSDGVLIRGAFDFDEFEFAPRQHLAGEPFVMGRMARPDPDKWSSNTWPIYSAVQYANKRALMMGIDNRTQRKLGQVPPFADCLQPNAMPVQQFLGSLHCLLPINGGARENWPRAGLEAMACGVPVVAQNSWGWREMIEHGVTGFLGSNDCELAHWAACLAHDEPLRQRIIRNARERLVEELANSEIIWQDWRETFEAVERKLAKVAA